MFPKSGSLACMRLGFTGSLGYLRLVLSSLAKKSETWLLCNNMVLRSDCHKRGLRKLKVHDLLGRLVPYSSLLIDWIGHEKKKLRT